MIREYPKAWGSWVEWFLRYARIWLFSTSFGPSVIIDWKLAPRFGVLSLAVQGIYFGSRAFLFAVPRPFVLRAILLVGHFASSHARADSCCR